jgi:sulfate adenylyltransferase large subunit/phosphoadenylyl-sulfate reductase (thioredoxin)
MNALTQTFSKDSPSRARPLVRVVIVGHVDHGKSTLIGRLLHETGSLADGKLEAIRAASARRDRAFEWSFLLDALQTEREQGITLDTSQIHIRTPSRDIVLIDAPGHVEFLRNMITGAAQADAALLMIDAVEGVREQTRRHGYLLHLLGIKQVAVIINKMDLTGFDQGRFREIEADIVAHLSQFGLTPSTIIPISARRGDGVAQRSADMAWYAGPTVLEMLTRFEGMRPLADLPLRIPVQAVYRVDDRRVIAGRVETGSIAVGDEVALLPRGTTARVRSIEAWPAPADATTAQAAQAGRSIGLLLDREVFVERGDVISAILQTPKAVRRLRARIFWLGEQPLSVGDSVTVRIAMAERVGSITLIEQAVDPADISAIGQRSVAQHQVGEIEIALSQPIVADLYTSNPRTGRLVLDRAGKICGGGLVLVADAAADPAPAVSRKETLVAEAARLNAHLANLSPAERIAGFRDAIEGKLVFTTSFGLEDQVILHLIAENDIDVEIATLDTGRLFRETYDVWAESERRYGRRIRAFYPQHDELENLVARYGINGFYDSREARLACCHVRKVVPLNRALSAAAGWIVGLRADQSPERGSTPLVSVDERNLLKLSPLFDWTRETVRAFAHANQIPVNELHARWFASIGCAPCTRAIAPGEAERAGRWWWEQEEKKECGIHNRPRQALA